MALRPAHLVLTLPFVVLTALLLPHQGHSAPVTAPACKAVGDTFARLACFERQHFLTVAPQRNCMNIAADLARLACFDGAPAPTARAVSASGSNTAAAPAPSKAKGLRIEAGLAFGQSHYNGTNKVMGGEVHMDSLLGPSGNITHMGLWQDVPAFDKMSFGIEYIHLKASSRIQADFPNGVSYFSDPSSASGRLEISADMLYANLAYTPRPHDSIRPYVGGGIGIGRGRIAADYALNSFLTSANHYTASSLVAGLQGFAGVQFDVWGDLYVAPNVRVLYFTAEPIDKDHEFVEAALGLSIGSRF